MHEGLIQPEGERERENNETVCTGIAISMHLQALVFCCLNVFFPRFYLLN